MHPLLSILLVACSSPVPTPGADPESFLPPVTGALPGADLYVLDRDVGAVVRFSPNTGGYVATALDATPGRMARAGGTLWVTLPADRGIAVLETSDGAPVRTGTIPTGAEPQGIAATADGAALYVALATTGAVQELSADGAVLRSWEIPGEPTWLALSPDEGSLYVGSAFGGTFTWIDLGEGVAHAVTLPEPYRSVFHDNMAGFPVPLTPRITGDLSVSADGTLVAVPMLYVDTTTPVDNPETTDDAEGYGSANSNEPSRFNPVVGLVSVGPSGEPDGPGASLVLATGLDEEGNALRSYFASTTFAPEGDLVFAAMEASSAVIAVATTPSSAGLGGMARGRTLTLRTEAGPGAVMLPQDDLAFVDCFIGRSVDSVSLVDIRAALAAGTDALGADIRQPFAASPLDFDVTAGRAHFYSAVDATMVTPGAGVSCSTCHMGGRNDGLTWPLPDGDRQTPSLAGGISGAAPYTWTNGVDSVAAEAMITSQQRMGGSLQDEEAEQIAAFVESIRAPDVPDLGSTDPAVARGQALFERADVGCAGCHRGALYTDNNDWALFGLSAVNTPSLRRVAASAPYLHDGRAPTLQALLELCADGSMGDTSMLSAAEREDLESYLRSL